MASCLDEAELRMMVQALGPEEAFGALKVAELKTYCKHFGLKPVGGKLEIIGALARYLTEKVCANEVASRASPMKPKRERKAIVAESKEVVKEGAQRAKVATVAGAVSISPASEVTALAQQAKPKAGKKRAMTADVPHITPEVVEEVAPATMQPKGKSDAKRPKVAEAPLAPEDDAKMRASVKPVYNAIPVGSLLQALATLDDDAQLDALEAHKLPELKAHCKRLGLKDSGKRNDLVKQLHMRARAHKIAASAARASAEFADTRPEVAMVKEDLDVTPDVLDEPSNESVPPLIAKLASLEPSEEVCENPESIAASTPSPSLDSAVEAHQDLSLKTSNETSELIEDSSVTEVAVEVTANPKLESENNIAAVSRLGSAVFELDVMNTSEKLDEPCPAVARECMGVETLSEDPVAIKIVSCSPDIGVQFLELDANEALDAFQEPSVAFARDTPDFEPEIEGMAIDFAVSRPGDVVEIVQRVESIRQSVETPDKLDESSVAVGGDIACLDPVRVENSSSEGGDANVPALVDAIAGVEIVQTQLEDCSKCEGELLCRETAPKEEIFPEVCTHVNDLSTRASDTEMESSREEVPSCEHIAPNSIEEMAQESASDSVANDASIMAIESVHEDTATLDDGVDCESSNVRVAEVEESPLIVESQVGARQEASDDVAREVADETNMLSAGGEAPDGPAVEDETEAEDVAVGAELVPQVEALVGSIEQSEECPSEDDAIVDNTLQLDSSDCDVDLTGSLGEQALVASTTIEETSGVEEKRVNDDITGVTNEYGEGEQKGEAVPEPTVTERGEEMEVSEEKVTMEAQSTGASTAEALVTPVTLEETSGKDEVMEHNNENSIRAGVSDGCEENGEGEEQESAVGEGDCSIERCEGLLNQDDIRVQPDECSTSPALAEAAIVDVISRVDEALENARVGESLVDGCQEGAALDPLSNCEMVRCRSDSAEALTGECGSIVQTDMISETKDCCSEVLHSGVEALVTPKLPDEVSGMIGARGDDDVRELGSQQGVDAEDLNEGKSSTMHECSQANPNVSYEAAESVAQVLEAEVLQYEPSCCGVAPVSCPKPSEQTYSDITSADTGCLEKLLELSLMEATPVKPAKRARVALDSFEIKLAPEETLDVPTRCLDSEVMAPELQVDDCYDVEPDAEGGEEEACQSSGKRRRSEEPLGFEEEPKRARTEAEKDDASVGAAEDEEPLAVEEEPKRARTEAEEDDASVGGAEDEEEPLGVDEEPKRARTEAEEDDASVGGAEDEEEPLGVEEEPNRARTEAEENDASVDGSEDEEAVQKSEDENERSVEDEDEEKAVHDEVEQAGDRSPGLEDDVEEEEDVGDENASDSVRSAGEEEEEDEEASAGSAEREEGQENEDASVGSAQNEEDECDDAMEAGDDAYLGMSSSPCSEEAENRR